MGEKSSAFVKGGCGCLVAFAILAFLAVILGGHAYIDPCGAIILFAAGGVGGLICLAIFNSGKRAGRTRRHDEPPRW